MSSEQRVLSTFPSSFDRDLENARVLIEDLPWRDNPQKYRKVAEGILRRILSFDPGNESAKLLLAKAEAPLSMPEPPPRQASPPPAPVVPVAETTVMAPAIAPAAPPPPPSPPPQQQIVQSVRPEQSVRPAAPPDLSFVVSPSAPRVESQESRRPPWGLIIFAAIGAIAGIVLLFAHRSTFTPQYPAKATTAAAPPVVQASASTVQPPPSADVSPAPPAAVEPPPVVDTEAKAATVPAAPAPPPTVVVKSAAPTVAPIQTGTLAVSSPTTVDIYIGDQLVGSAPTSLVLPAGNQTLEYRHQDMRKTVTHNIKANETTTAMITFDVPVEINARPWAQVFVDGPQRRSLGQTPLSDVRVPIGSLLIFENPNFPGKTYRITGRETQIRVTFP